MHTTAVVIGAGQSGLAMSRCLSERSIDHVVLERARSPIRGGPSDGTRCGCSRRTGSAACPATPTTGPDPDGFMTMPEVVDFITSTPRRSTPRCSPARPSRRCVRDGTVPGDHGPRGMAVHGRGRRAGAFNVPHLPACRRPCHRGDDHDALEYRNPDLLAEGGVLVVGASATGVQIACEVQRSGRQVTLAVGEHVRGSSRLSGTEIFIWWMEASGVLDERYDEVDDIVRARRVPSMQLAGSPERATFDLNALTNAGVKLVGRLAGISGRQGPVLRVACGTSASSRTSSLAGCWTPSMSGPRERPRRLGAAASPVPPTVVGDSPPLGLDLASGEIKTVIWATGFRPDYSWLDIPVFDGKGMLRHDGGVVDSPGMFLLGSPFLRRRKSSFIDGARQTPENSWVNSRTTLTQERRWRAVDGRRRRPSPQVPCRPESSGHANRLFQRGAR